MGVAPEGSVRGNSGYMTRPSDWYDCNVDVGSSFKRFPRNLDKSKGFELLGISNGLVNIYSIQGILLGEFDLSETKDFGYKKFKTFVSDQSNGYSGLVFLQQEDSTNNGGNVYKMIINLR